MEICENFKFHFFLCASFNIQKNLRGPCELVQDKIDSLKDEIVPIANFSHFTISKSLRITSNPFSYIPFFFNFFINKYLIYDNLTYKKLDIYPPKI